MHEPADSPKEYACGFFQAIYFTFPVLLAFPVFLF